jgi:AraC-like DNA-binding protein
MAGMEVTESLLEVVHRYVDRRITRRRAAALLKISERQVTRLCEHLGLERVKSTRAEEEEEAAKRRLAKVRAAEEVLAGRITLAAGAQRAGCHERTIQRHVDRLKKAAESKKKKRR